MVLDYEGKGLTFGQPFTYTAGIVEGADAQSFTGEATLDWGWV